MHLKCVRISRNNLKKLLIVENIKFKFSSYEIYYTVERVAIVVVSDMLEEPFLSSLELDRDFLQTVLRESEEDPRLRIVGVESTPGCDMGDNFMSAVTRIVIRAESAQGEKVRQWCLLPSSCKYKAAYCHGLEIFNICY